MDLRYRFEVSKFPSVSDQRGSSENSGTRSIGSVAASPAGDTQDMNLVFNVGEQLSGGFTIVKLIGQGAMGQVFEAQDQALRRRVALKALMPGNDPALLRKEAQALAAIRHPGLVVIHGLGAHRGIEFLIMERILGVTLEEHLERRKGANEHFTVAEAVDLLLPIAGVLTAIHGAGVAHRDVKPSNIMLCPGDRIVLMDLGIVAPEVEVGQGAPMVGTPYYMAPEAIEGAVEPGTAHLLDIYALGVIAYEMLSGERPYEGETTLEVLDQHLNSAVPDVEKVMPWIPVRLATLIRDCMAKDSGERPPSIEAVVWQLKAIREKLRAPLAAEGYSVLIVDSNPQHASILARTAERVLDGAEVLVVGSGDRALDLVQKKAPSLILIDLALQGMNGVELCMYLRGTPAAAKSTMAAVCQAATEGDLEVLKSLGVSHFIEAGAGIAQDWVKLLERIVPGASTR
jgi:serine/threonine-protein kinase